MHERGKVLEGGEQLQMGHFAHTCFGPFTLLFVEMFFIYSIHIWTLDFAHRMVLNEHTSPLNTQSIHDSSVARLFIFTPTRPVKTHVLLLLCKKKESTHTHIHTYCVPPYNTTQWYICICTGYRGLEELCLSICC